MKVNLSSFGGARKNVHRPRDNEVHSRCTCMQCPELCVSQAYFILAATKLNASRPPGLFEA